MSQHRNLDEADRAAECGGPTAYTLAEIQAMPPAPGMQGASHELVMQELQELLTTVGNVLEAAKVNGELWLADARLLRGKAQWLESLTERAAIDKLRSVPVVLPGSAEDKARQRVVGR